MILQTVQKIKVLEEIEKNGISYGNFEESSFKDDSSFVLAYQWMKQNLEKKFNPILKKDMFWGWAYASERKKKIDLRSYRVTKDEVVLTIEKNQDEILISDFSLWHHVLNYWPIYYSIKDEKYWDKLSKCKNTDYYRKKPLKKPYDEELRKTWELIFLIEEIDNKFFLNLKSKYKKFLGMESNIVVQAVFWDIKKEEIKEIKNKK